ncbi:MAG: hypothetical protein QOG03_2008 [Actinomycetota bacterium]|jgi:hypothetical protein|nr:hypothetical protein [Actinomycetota bacterium]
MVDWTTVSSLATGAGTLVLAIATFAAVRSANRSARVTERSLQAGIRPVIVTSRLGDAPEKVGFADNKWFKVEGGRAVAEATDEAVYLVVALRNVGTGLAVLDRWDFYDERPMGDGAIRSIDGFRRLTRDLYIAPGDQGFWQGAFRDPADPVFQAARAAIEDQRSMTIDLLYGDHEGGQRAVSRFSLIPDGSGGWLAVVVRHWNLDRDDPR